MLEEFKNYVSGYDMNDTNISFKYYHSIRVMELSKLIAKYAGFNEEDIKIVEVASLLHDYGRFPQWEKYHTYKDHESIDHADLAVEKLFGNKEITKFWTKEEDYDEIYDAIKYHNKLSVPNDLSSHNQLLCKVIRDADKLDILYLYAAKHIDFPEDGEISNFAKDSFDNEVIVDKRQLTTEADFGVVVLALVYDLNFKYSFEHLKEYKLISRIYENVKDKEKFKYYFDKIEKYIDKKIREME